MKSIVGFYKGVGSGAKAFMGAKTGPILNGTHPPLWQTPGKVQYYKAEMEPYVPGKYLEGNHSLLIMNIC
jgi:hypothetical protein